MIYDYSIFIPITFPLSLIRLFECDMLIKTHNLITLSFAESRTIRILIINSNLFLINFSLSATQIKTNKQIFAFAVFLLRFCSTFALHADFVKKWRKVNQMSKQI